MADDANHEIVSARLIFAAKNRPLDYLQEKIALL